MLADIAKRGALAGTALVTLEAAYAVLRPSPYLPEFDPSGILGYEHNPELKVAVLGDSSVTAPGVAHPDEIWIRQVCHRLAEAHHVLLRSFAVGGSKASDLVAGQMHAAIEFEPDIIFVSVGANDALKAVPRKRFESNLDALVGRLSQTGAIIVQSGVGDLGSIPRLYPPLSSLVSLRASQFDQVHWRVAARHGTRVIDQRSDERDPWYSDSNLWSADQFHVSAAGHSRWAETAWRTVGPLVLGTDAKV